MTPKLLLCDCGGTQPLDREALAAATGLACSRVHSALCTRQIESAATALSDPGAEVVIACAQEAETFAALAEDLDAAPPLCTDIRDRAGWSDEAEAATPKIAALLAAALRGRTPARSLEVTSRGMCLITGAAETVLPVADQLADTLAVTCLVTDTPEILPGPARRYDVISGALRQITGAIGSFAVTIDGFRPADPTGRGPLTFPDPRDGATSTCDIVLDLSGTAPLFAAHEKRDGYLRADPGDAVAVQRAAFAAAQLVGTFDKTLHVALDESLCAHARAGQTGCTRCLDLCPTGAIVPNGDSVQIDPLICAGCGACSAACPSGAVSYTDPPVADVFAELATLADSFGAAGGTGPRLLVHDDTHGREMISLAARLGRGLPADVLPLELASVASFGHAEILAALACGFAEARILLSPKTERGSLETEMTLAHAILSGTGQDATRASLIDPADPDALCDLLYSTAPDPLAIDPILPLGSRRDTTRLAARALTATPGTVPLPAGAPYGAVVVDTDACTLCLSCAGLCPSGALEDNPDTPQLRFKENACLQCGLCATLCPENAITLVPRLDLTDDALKLRVLHEEEPYDCIECGKPFGVRSTIERIVEKLDGKHSLFTNSDNTRLIRMCDDCRVQAQFHSSSAPFIASPRPRVRTTDDYLKERDTDD